MTAAQFGELLARIDRLISAVESLSRDRPAAKRKCAFGLLPALAENFPPGEIFSAADCIAAAAQQRAACERTGLAPTPLVSALDGERITTPRQLARYLTGHEGLGVVRAGRDERGVLWALT